MNSFAIVIKRQLADRIKKELNAKAESKIRQRGQAIFNEGRVWLMFIEEQAATFLAWGTSRYTVELKWRGKEDLQLELSCTCPYGDFCKHRAAVLYYLMSGERELEPLYEELHQYIVEPSAKSNGARASTSNLAPTSPKKLPFRNAIEPYHIHRVSELGSEALLNHVTPNSTKRAIPDSMEMEEREGTFYFKCGYRYAFYWEEYNVSVRVENDVLSVCCNCDRRIKYLCTHAYGALSKLLNEDPGFFTQDRQERLQQKAREIMHHLGLPEEEPWTEYLEWKHENGDFHFYTTKEYEGLINPDQLNSENLEPLLKVNPEWELPKAGNETKYNCGYHFEFLDNHYVLEPLRGAVKDPNGRFKNKIKPLSMSNDRDQMLTGEDDVKLFYLADQLKEQFYTPQDEYQRETLNQLQQYSALLERHPRIYIYHNSSYSSYYNPTFRQMDLEAVDFVGGSPQLRVSFSQRKDIIFAEVQIRVDESYHPLRSDFVSIPHLHFVKFKEKLFLHYSLRDALTFSSLYKEPTPACSVAKFPELYEKIWSPLSRFCEMDFSAVDDFKTQEKEMYPMQKELYLSEIGDFIVMKPIAYYDNEQRVEVLSRVSSMTSVSGDEIAINYRSEEWEEQFIEEIRSLHPDLAKQRRSDFFHLKLKQFLEDNWFLKVFPKMQELGIEVYGWKDLSKLKVNPNPAQVTYKVNHKTDWFETEVKVAFGDTEVSLAELKKRITAEGYVKLSDGTMGKLPEEWYKKLQKLFEHGNVKGKKVQVSDKLFNLVDELFEEIDDDGVGAFIQEKKKKLLEFDEIQRQALPEGINAQLRHYQEDGYHWMCFLDEFQWGGILADDMGLGKTLQVITFLQHVLQKNSQTNLVIVPTSLLFNWQNELEKFAPDLKAYFYHGQGRVKELEHFDEFDVVFTSYGLMRRDVELLREYAFNYIILDESQAIKNPASKRYKAARLLQANNRIALTGTPVENNTFDLYAQISFLNPGLLGSAASFKKNYAYAIDSKRDEQRAADLQKIIKPFVLRRTKEQVASELPDKVEDVLYCEMSPAQRKVYDAYRNRYRDQLLQKIDDEGMNNARFSVLEGLTKLRQICDTPEILSGDEKYDSPSAKVDELLQHIREKTGNHKILVFSQFVQMLQIIEKEIREAGIEYEYLDGQSSLEQRQESVRHFQEEENCRVFLISLKAGGTGLNLMAADYVYLVDPWWNPAVENQAIDRCYRIGQDKKVIAYRMICKDTVEEKILKLQERKKALASDLVQTDEHVLKQLDKDAIMDLFGG